MASHRPSPLPRQLLTTVLPLLLLVLPLLAAASSGEDSAKPRTNPTVPVSQTAVVDGVRLHYLRAGQGPLVVLLHGYPETSAQWKDIMPLLARHYTVIAPDLRGLGDSERTGPYDKKTVAEDVYKLVRQLGFTQAVVVGHDLGGAVAYAYAAQHPTEVRKLVIADMLLPGFGLEQAMDVANGGAWHFGFHMAPDFPEALTEGRERLYLALFILQYLIDSSRLTPALLDEYTRTYSSPGGMKAGFDYYRTLLQDGEDNRQLAASVKLTMPVLAMGGSGTKAIGPYWTAGSLEGVVADKRQIQTVEITDSGHFVTIENPLGVARALRDFIGK